MATTPYPARSGRSPRRSWWWIGGVAAIIVALVAALLLARGAGSGTATTTNTTTVTRGSIVASVAGSGTVAAAQMLDLSFQLSGTVAEVLVAEGDTVTAGQPLARLDSRDLEVQVASAQAALDSARARLAQTAEGNATPEQIAASKASVASAQAQLRSAQAQLNALKDPASDQVSTAETDLRQAELELQATRDNASATKTKAEQDMNRAVDNLTQAQSAFALAKRHWEWVEANGTDPVNPTTTGANGKKVKNTLSEGQRAQYYDKLVQAEAALRSAEQAVAQAQVTFDNARQAEVANVQKAEATLANAQTQLAALKTPDKNDLAQRQASVDQARAALAQAQANLAQLTAPATASDQRIQQASVAQAEQSLRQAQLKLAQATLTAPFDGIVSAVNIVPGSSVTATVPAVSLVDRDPLHVELKLSENDVAKVKLGQSVTLTIDALKGWQATGTVSYIAPAAETTNGVVTYPVRVDVADTDARVKVGMTANLSIMTATKDNVLLVPNSALLPKGAGRVVQIPGANGRGITEVEVQTGLTDGTYTEIVSGLTAGQTIIATPVNTAQTQRGGLLP
jgi:HlyD family secretion protein